MPVPAAMGEAPWYQLWLSGSGLLLSGRFWAQGSRFRLQGLTGARVSGLGV